MPLLTTHVLQLLATPEDPLEREKLLNQLFIADHTGNVQNVLADIENKIFAEIESEASPRPIVKPVRRLFPRKKPPETTGRIRKYTAPWMWDLQHINAEYNGAFCRYRPTKLTHTRTIQIRQMSVERTVTVTTRDYLLPERLMPTELYTGLSDSPESIDPKDRLIILTSSADRLLRKAGTVKNRLSQILGDFVDNGVAYGVICNRPDIDDNLMENWLPWEINPLYARIADDLLHTLHHERHKNISVLTDTDQGLARITDKTLVTDLITIVKMKGKVSKEITDELTDLILDTFDDLPDDPNHVSEVFTRSDANASVTDIRNRYTSNS